MNLHILTADREYCNVCGSGALHRIAGNLVHILCKALRKGLIYPFCPIPVKLTILQNCMIVNDWSGTGMVMTAVF